MKNLTFFVTVSFIFITCIDNPNIRVAVINIPDTTGDNVNYQGNRSPLTRSVLIKLPVGSIVPGSWLRVNLERQADGLCGNLGEISAWLQKDNNAWLSPDGKGVWGWEEVPYWLRGYADLGYILDRKDIISEAKIWIEGTLKSQRADGNFGPIRFTRDSVQDFWANMIMLDCLRSWYEYSGDKRVIELMTKYFKYQLSVPDKKFLSRTTYWQWIRGGDNLSSVIWLYNITGEKWLLKLAEKNHRCTAPWSKRGMSIDEVANLKQLRDGFTWPGWYGNLIDWHNVNVAQGFREPAQYYQLSHNKADLQATYENFNIVRDHFGQVPGGMFGADEDARPGYDDPRQGIETCGIVEQMNSNEQLLQITGDIFWADNTEDVAFNTFPAALMPDFKSLRYFTCPNMAISDSKNHSPGIANDGPFLMMNPFSSRCCQHNHSQGWPYLAENLWMATDDNGLAAVIYAANTVRAKVADHKEIIIKCDSNYPFEDTLTFVINLKEPVKCPLYFRIPGWCKDASLSINNKKVSAIPVGGKYIRVERTWKNNDSIILLLPSKIKIHTWTKNHNSVSVDYGALTFSLKIKENYVKKESHKTAESDSKWQKGADPEKWPSYELLPASDWNYGLILNEKDPALSFEIKTRNWPEDNYPFTTDAVPVVLTAKAQKIDAWKIDKYGLTGELQDSPVKSDNPVETIELIPMGAARLRISAFPVIGSGSEAIKWK